MYHMGPSDGAASHYTLRFEIYEATLYLILFIFSKYHHRDPQIFAIFSKQKNNTIFYKNGKQNLTRAYKIHFKKWVKTPKKIIFKKFKNNYFLQ